MLNFIVNPNSGGEKGFSTWKKVERQLKKQKIRYQVMITDCRGDATRISRQICEADNEPKTIVAVGGDGTLNEVINGLILADHVTLGYIPTGSGNDLARGMGYPSDPVRALDRILKCEKITEIDYGVISYGDKDIINRRFAVSCGAGYDAAVCDVLHESAWRRRLAPFHLQKVAYTVLGAKTLLSTRPVKGSIILDNERKIEFNDILFVAVHNQPTEGGGYRFAPQAVNNDGRLSVCVVHTRSKLQFAKILLAAKPGNHLKYQGVRTYDCKHIRVELEEPMSMHSDGEILGHHRNFEAHCVERKLRMII